MTAAYASCVPHELLDEINFNCCRSVLVARVDAYFADAECDAHRRVVSAVRRRS
jgi:hypothetical protein